MPPRKTSDQRAPSGGRQATLSFHHRVTKAAAAKPTAKEAVLAAAKKTENITTKKKAVISRTGTPESDTPSTPTESTKPIKPTEPATPKSEAEIAAEKEAEAVSQARIKRYWREIEGQRMAKRVHQTGLDLGDRVLRYFDVSSQFGPCVGITRKRRWLRARRLGLSPPIEVLAVLLQEEAEGKEVEESSIDDILNPAVAN